MAKRPDTSTTYSLTGTGLNPETTVSPPAASSVSAGVASAATAPEVSAASDVTQVDAELPPLPTPQDDSDVISPDDIDSMQDLQSYADGQSPLTPINRSPLDLSDRVKLSLGNKVGKLNYLKQRFDGAEIDKHGNFLINDGGSWYRADPDFLGDGDAWQRTKEIIADMADLSDIGVVTAGQIGGAAAGATVASPTIAGVPAAAIAGGALGAAAGGALKSRLGRLVGTYSASPEEEIKDAALEGVLGLGGEVVGLGAKVGMNGDAGGGFQVHMPGLPVAAQVHRGQRGQPGVLDQGRQGLMGQSGHPLRGFSLAAQHDAVAGLLLPGGRRPGVLVQGHQYRVAVRAQISPQAQDAAAQIIQPVAGQAGQLGQFGGRTARHGVAHHRRGGRTHRRLARREDGAGRRTAARLRPRTGSALAGWALAREGVVGSADGALGVAAAPHPALVRSTGFSVWGRSVLSRSVLSAPRTSVTRTSWAPLSGTPGSGACTRTWLRLGGLLGWRHFLHPHLADVGGEDTTTRRVSGAGPVRVWAGAAGMRL